MTIKLLAVDDSSTMRKVLGITFAGDGFQITTCKSGAEALEAVRNGPPAVALVDASIAGESGYALCSELRKAVPGLPVLILSSKQRGYDEGAAKSAGAVGNFDKPFDSQKLIDKVQSVLGQGSVATGAVEARPAQPAPVVAAAPPAATGPVAVARVTLSTAQVPAGSAQATRSAPQPAPRPLAPAPFASEAAPAPKPVPSAAPAPAVSAKTSAGSDFSNKLNGLGLSAEQVAGVLALSKDVVEQVVWEIVPALAETMIREEIRRLTADSK